MPKPMHSGFTLLEMLVVMVLLTLLMSLIGPNFVGQMDKSRAHFAADQFKNQVIQLPRWSRLLGRPFKLEKLSASWQLGNEELLTLPEGWRTEFRPALFVSPSQLCTSSTAQLLDDTGTLISTLSITGPSCEVSEALP